MSDLELFQKIASLTEENDKLKSALNRIGIMAMSELAYTSDFTDHTQDIVREALGNKKDSLRGI